MNEEITQILNAIKRGEPQARRGRPRHSCMRPTYESWVTMTPATDSSTSPAIAPASHPQTVPRRSCAATSQRRLPARTVGPFPEFLARRIVD